MLEVMPALLLRVSFKNSETVKTATLAFCTIQYYFITIICTKSRFLTLPNLQSLGKTQMGVFPDFRTYDQFFINKNCRNSKINHDIDIKLRPVTKFNKRNTVTSKKRLVMTSCHQIMTSLSFF